MRMRRRDRQIKEIKEILEILDNNDVCRVAFKDEEGIYIVPLNYGYEYNNEKLTLYFHGANKGRKISAFENNSEVGFEIDQKKELLARDEKLACTYTYQYSSIIGNGIAKVISDKDEKRRAFEILMKHVAKKEGLEFNEAVMGITLVMKIEVTGFSAKGSKG